MAPRGLPAESRELVECYDVTSADGTVVRAWRNRPEPGALPVVVSNGLGTPPEAWPGVVGDPRRFHAVGWYYRGTGGGGRPADPSHVRIVDHVDDLLAVMDDNDIESAVLACWSLGVNVAFEAAARHPDRVAGILAVAGVPGGTFHAMGGPLLVPRRLRHYLGVGAAHLLRAGAPALQALARSVPMTPASAWMIAHSGIVMPAARPEVLLPALREFRTHDWRWYFTLALGAADHHRMDLSFVGAPTTIVAGKWDVLTSKEDMLEAAAEIPHSKVEVLPGSHFLPLEFPDEIGLLLWELLGRTELATVARAV